MWRIKTDEEFSLELGNDWRASKSFKVPRGTWTEGKDAILGLGIPERVTQEVAKYGMSYWMDTARGAIWHISDEMIIEEIEVEF